MDKYRETLTRNCFELERNFHYQEFRNHHWNLAEVVATCPIESEREEVLRGFWRQDAEQRWPEYQKAVAGLSLEALEAEYELWQYRLSCLSEREFQEILAEQSRRSPANDNGERGGREI